MSQTATLVVLVLLALFLLPAWPYSSGWGVGYYPSGALVLLMVVLLLVVPFRRGRGLP